MQNHNILYIGGPTGFAGGIERYAFQTAQLLRQHGAHMTWCGLGTMAREHERFLDGFDRVASIGQVLTAPDNYALVALHKLPDLDTLNALRKKFGERLVFWTHDHDLYCPRRYYYTPFGRTNCHRAYAPLRCQLCSLMVSPRQWKYRHRHHTALLDEVRQHHAVVLSDYMANNLRKNGFQNAKIHLLHPQVQVSNKQNNIFTTNKLNIIFIGQLIRGKGVDLLLQALARLTIPWHAKIVGDGPDRPLLETLADRLGLRDRLEFTGWLPQPELAYPGCDVAVFPSRWQEPFGLAGAEAQAHGLPVVAFEVGGVREWLQDGVTGHVVPPQDIAAMALALEELFRNPAHARQLGENARKHIQELFSPENFLTAFRQLTETGAK